MASRAVLLSPRFQAALKNLNSADLVRVEDALRGVPDIFGKPHVHAGLSIRRLRKNIYECRAGLKLRLLFRATTDALEFFFVGDHNSVQRLIRTL